jgi:DNA invertase Pin-like site-specific DNA recombinase
MDLVAFARLSQYADGKTGIDTQDEDDRRWAADNSHEIVQMVADHISGRVPPFKRKNAGKWLNDPALMALYDGILVAKIDRLTRHRDWDIRQWAEQHGKKIIIVNPTLIWPPEPGDIATPIIWDNLVNIAASEWAETSKRWKRMQQSKRDQKSFVGKPPYGYRIVKLDGTNLKTLEPDPETAPVVKSIFQMYDQGMSIYQIVDSLNGAGIRSPQGQVKGWQHNTVRRILQNPSTVGRIQYKGATVLRVPPLVSQEDFNRVNARIKSRATRGPGRKETALLTGMVFCDNGSPMYRQRARSDDFYYCNHGCPAGSRLMVKVSYLDSVVDDMVMSVGDEPHMITVVTAGDDHSDEIDQIRLEIRDLDPEADDYDTRLSELRGELANLRSLPSTPRKVEYKPSGKTIGEVWQSLDTAGKRRFLQDAGVRFHVSRGADREVSVVIGPDPATFEGGDLYRLISALGGRDYPATFKAVAEAEIAELERQHGFRINPDGSRTEL